MYHKHFSTSGPFPCGFPKFGISQKLGFRAFLAISGRFYGDFRCPRAPEIHIFCLKSRFLREILKKSEILILGKTTWEGLREGKRENLGLNSSQGWEEEKTQGWIIAKGGKKRKPRTVIKNKGGNSNTSPDNHPEGCIQQVRVNPE